VIALDTNLLARFYVDDPSDPEAARQRPVARRLILGPQALFVPVTVVLELEWVMRGFYEVRPESFCAAIEHLLGLPGVTVDRWEAVEAALEVHRAGIDFADAMHWALSRGCSEVASPDDRRFARRAARLGLEPPVTVPR
jgi:predicted nucleic-acid-binding protein